MHYFGFDLGDGESCVTWSPDITITAPIALPINGELSFISAVGRFNGEIVIGKLAYPTPGVEDLHVCFKRHYLEKRADIDQAIVDFATGVLNALRQNQQVKDFVDDPEQSCFVVGCPAAWDQAAREHYRELLHRAGMQNVRIASESRAAFENALRTNNESVDPDLINDSVLVIDIGSSTLDLAYVCDGQEYNVQTVGDNKLGGGLMDEMILQYALKRMGERDPEGAMHLRGFLLSNHDWHSRVMLEAREIKEQYFNNEDYYFDNDETLISEVRILGGAGMNYRLRLMLSPDIVENFLITQPHQLLDGQGFKSRLMNTLKGTHQRVQKREPKLVILTGGPSRMRFFQEMCRKEFAKSRLIISQQPEQDIARGLTFAGNVDDGVVRFLNEVKKYVAGSAVRQKVSSALPELIESIAQHISKRLLPDCVLPCFQQWKSGQLDTLNSFKQLADRSIKDYLKSAAGRKVVAEASKPWAKSIMDDIQGDIDAIASRFKLSLQMLQAQGVEIGVGTSGEAINFAAQFLGSVELIIMAIVAAVAAVICGGAETALIAAGPIGAIVGVALVAIVFLVGKDKALDLLMSTNIPKIARKAVPESTIISAKNIEKTAAAVRKSMLESAELSNSISTQVGDAIIQSISDMISNTEKNIVS